MKLTAQSIKKITSDENCLNAARELLKAQARTLTVKEIIEPKQREVLKKHQFISESYARDKMVITEPSQAWLLNNKDFDIYMGEMNKFYIEKGFNVKLGECPLLMAEQREREKQSIFIDSLQKHTGITKNELLKSGMEVFKKYIDVNLKYLTQFL